jgi:hypothetical protein
MTTDPMRMNTPANPATSPFRGPPRESPRRTGVALRLSYYRRRHPYTPTQEAAVGALEIFAEGRLADDIRKMLFGLSVLANATAAQIDVAISTLHFRGIFTGPQLRGMLRDEPLHRQVPLLCPALL